MLIYQVVDMQQYPNPPARLYHVICYNIACMDRKQYHIQCQVCDDVVCF